MAVEYKIIGGDGREYGPASLEEIRDWTEQGRISHGTPVWRGDEQRWLPAGAREELRWDLPEIPSLDSEKPIPEPAAEIRPAGFWIRAAAFLFDFLLINLLVSFLTSPWADRIEKMNAVLQEQRKLENPDSELMMQYLPLMLMITGAFVLVQLVYSVGFNGLQGATPGKRLFGIKIVTGDGEKLTLGRALLRHCTEWLSKLTLGMGYLQVLFNPERKALHDVLANTTVIYSKKSN
jgi:uncharacterized RDD family membrane protein YckC